MSSEAAETIGTEDLVDVCETVGPGDEVELETVSQAYKNPLEVDEVVVTEWIGADENWRTARLVLKGGRGAEHRIVGVEGNGGVTDYTSGKPFRVRRLVPAGVEPDEALQDDEDDDGPLAPEESPHKYTTGGALDEMEDEPEEDGLDPLQDGDRRPWDELGIDVPPDLSREDLEDAVEHADRLYGVCDELGLPYDDRGIIRVLLINEDLYNELKTPEGRRMPRGST